MTDAYQIHLNILPVLGVFPDFRIYRRLRGNPQEDRPVGPNIHSHWLPKADAFVDDKVSYWVSPEPVHDFEPFMVKPHYNFDLTIGTMLWAIEQKCKKDLGGDDYWLPDHGYRREIHFNMVRHKEGVEQLVARPYYLRAAKTIGIVVDFHFRLAEGEKFSRKVQQLSLGLDSNFRRNLDCYADRLGKIMTFVKKLWGTLSPIQMPAASAAAHLGLEFAPLNAVQLQPKFYVFGNSRESRSQFMGLKEYGPLKPLDASPNLLFVFREQDRQAARILAASLRGNTQRGRFTFPGFEHLFKTPLVIDHNPVVVTDFSSESMKTALERTKSAIGLTVPVLVMPDNDEQGYLNHKALFTNADIPSQVCTLGVILNENTLKWSVANLALQIFCKAGGQPWKVRPAGDGSLIIGISQSHKIRVTAAGRAIEKYFAFSILTDSSGLFQKIQVLGQGANKTDYLNQLRDNLRNVLATGMQQFSNVVIHTSFKLKYAEVDAIRRVVQEVAKQPRDTKTRFAVVKVNHKSAFFGINRGTNSLVPFEGTRVKLGRGEYLVWFEGIFPDKPTVTKAFPGPTHLQFMKIGEDAEVSDDLLLQDLVNLSGANWRGFNAKSSPVSVFFCHLVADFMHEFQGRGLPPPDVAGLKPWFL